MEDQKKVQAARPLGLAAPSGRERGRRGRPGPREGEVERRSVHSELPNFAKFLQLRGNLKLQNGESGSLCCSHGSDRVPY